MKRFFTKYGFAVLLTATIVALALSLMTFLSNHINVLENAAGTIAAPFRSAAAFVVDWVDDQLRYVEAFDEMRDELRELRQRVAEMEEQLRQAQEDSEENQRLRELLELRERRRDLSDFETATVIERSVSNWSAVMTLSKGETSGIEVGDCALTAEGYLVGFITAVGSNWSTLQTVVDTDASMGAQVFRSGDIAVAEGDFALMRENKLKLTYLPAGCTLLVGDLVVTSGLGGYCPSGVVIGSVEELVVDEGGLAQYAVIAPSARLDELSQVFIVKSFEIVE